MDTVEFKTVYSVVEDYKVVDIVVNQSRLVDMLFQIELPLAYQEGAPEMAGAYEGLPPLLVLPPSAHFYGEADQAYRYPENKTCLLEYAYSGVPGDWPFVARIEVGKRVVRWYDFEQVRRLRLKNGYLWNYDALDEFAFERKQYDEALNEAARKAYA